MGGRSKFRRARNEKTKKETNESKNLKSTLSGNTGVDINVSCTSMAHQAKASEKVESTEPIENGLSVHTAADCSQAANCSTSVINETNSIDGLSVFDVSKCLVKMSASRRLDAVMGVLDVLGPLEIRFLATAVEHLGRRDSANLRQLEGTFNHVDSVQSHFHCTPFVSLVSSMSVGLALLHSTNRPAAYLFAKYLKTMTDSMEKEVSRLVDGTRRWELVEQLRTALTAASHHPALILSQRLHARAVRSQLDTLFPQHSLPATVDAAVQTDHYMQPTIYVMNVQEVAVGKESYDEICCQVDWTDAMQTFCVKTPMELKELHYQLLDSFPFEAGYQGANRLLPYLSLPQMTTDLKASHFSTYLRSLSDMPARMLMSPVVVSFFWPSRKLSSDVLPTKRTVKEERKVPDADLCITLPLCPSDRPKHCPNCSQTGHTFAECSQRSLHEIAATGDFKLKWNEGDEK